MSKRADLKPSPPLQALDLLQRYEIPEACAYLRISRARLYDKIRHGQIKIIKDGGRTFVPGSEIAAQSSLDAADQNQTRPAPQARETPGPRCVS